VGELPDGYFVVVNNAYSLSTTLLTPYSGTQTVVGHTVP
jgi:hypothetical protein